MKKKKIAISTGAISLPLSVLFVKTFVCSFMRGVYHKKSPVKRTKVTKRTKIRTKTEKSGSVFDKTVDSHLCTCYLYYDSRTMTAEVTTVVVIRETFSDRSPGRRAGDQ